MLLRHKNCTNYRTAAARRRLRVAFRATVRRTCLALVRTAFRAAARRTLVRTTFRAAARRTPVRPAFRATARRVLVRTAFRAAALRAVALRHRAAPLACRARARRVAAARGSRRSARRTARERRVDGRRRRPPPAVSVLSLVRALVPRAGGSSTPARRAFERPMAIACLAERAPCFPSRTCRISSRTNSPACVVGALPIRLSLRARSIVLCSGMSSTTSRFPLLSCVTVVAHRPKAQLSCNYRDGPTQVPRRTPAAAGSSIDLDNALRFAWGLLGLHSK